jgi:phosphate starvation-inducible protein PhoH
MRESECEKVVVVRSPIATTDVGFLPGDLETKLSVLESPYIGIINELFDHTSKDKIYEKLKEQKLYEFVSCAYLRGMTINNAIIIVDEYQNLDFHSFDSIITRVGRNSKIILCGDDTQTDLTKSAEITGMKKIHHILDHMASFRGINFTIDDVVRSGLCKEYLLTKHRLGL